MNDDIFLCLDHGEFLKLSDAAPRADGTIGAKFRKQIIKTGAYFKESDGQQFEITDQTLSHWAETFHTMKRNGVKVPIPLGHNESAEANRGWVTDLFVDDDALVMTCELFDSDVGNLVKRNDVSIASPPQWTDGGGNEYVRPIRHIALTPVPVIPGLDAFRPLAASHERNKGMTKEQWAALAKSLNIDEELTDDTAATLLLSHVSGIEAKTETAIKAAKTVQTQLDALKVEVGEQDGGKTKIDDTLLSLAHENREAKLEALVVSAKITPAVRDKLMVAFVGEADGALRLSLETKTQDVFNQMVDALKDNDPVKLGEQTGRQDGKLELDDPNKGAGSESAIVKNAKARAEAVKGKPGYRSGY